MKKALARGRVLGNSNSEFTRMLENDGDAKAFTPKSDKQAKFVKTVVLSGKIELKTFVDASANGRDQAILSRESVIDISRTIKLQQFLPAISREVNGRIEILDGTRRRAACIYNNVRFEILVTEGDTDLTDTRQLAKGIQIVREHSLRELGKRLEAAYGTSMTKGETTLAENISSAKVIRALRAASVPGEMISVFPVINNTSLSDYQFLLKLSEEANRRKTSVKELMDKVRQKLMVPPGYPATDKSKVLSVFRAESKALMGLPVKTVEAERLKGFADHNQLAKGKTDSKKWLIVYRFSRVSNEVRSEINEATKRTPERLPSSGG